MPFVIDSDGVMQVKEELKTVNAIRRFECRHCVRLGKKPMVWLIKPCCMPMTLEKCLKCETVLDQKDHYCNDVLPPIATDGQQEPIL